MFGVNAAGLILMGQLNAHLDHKSDPRNLLSIGSVAASCGAVLLLPTACVGSIGLWGVLPAFFLVVASHGLITPNATALALARHPGAAGSASAVIGVCSMLAGAIVAPLTGLSGQHSLTALAIIILACYAASLVMVAIERRNPAYRERQSGID